MGSSRLALLAISLGVACTGAHGIFPADPDAGLEQCSYPTTLVAPDEPGAWAVGHALLVCKDGSAGTVCLSDGKNCPGSFVSADGACNDECSGDEYAVSYGGAGPTSASLTPPLPAGCHDPGNVDFDGVTYVCCPCE